MLLCSTKREYDKHNESKRAPAPEAAQECGATDSNVSITEVPANGIK